MTTAQAIQQQLASVTRARSETGVFIRMADRFAVVNIGTSTVTVPCIGFYPPTTGMSVRIDWVNGSPAVTGPVRPLSPLGSITAAGTPRATVLVDGESHVLPVMSSYTPVVGDAVLINWNLGGVITGKLAAVATPPPPDETKPQPKPFSVIVRATNSGRYDKNWGNWWGNDPWASNSNDGIWVYGNRIRDAVGGGTVTSIELYMPLITTVGNVSVGLHNHGGIPGGAPSIGTLTSLPNRSGWRGMPVSFRAYLSAAGGRGIGMTAPGGGNTQWRGTARDSLSGALRVRGVR